MSHFVNHSFCCICSSIGFKDRCSAPPNFSPQKTFLLVIFYPFCHSLCTQYFDTTGTSDNMSHGPSLPCCIVSYCFAYLFLSSVECKCICEKVVISFLFHTLKALVLSRFRSRVITVRDAVYTNRTIALAT